jgi:hypothetical protein
MKEAAEIKRVDWASDQDRREARRGNLGGNSLSFKDRNYTTRYQEPNEYTIV